MNPSTSRPRLACMISARNLGDAAGHGTVVAELLARGYAERFLVWTKPGMAFLFDRIPRCEVVTSPLPSGTGNHFGWQDISRVVRGAAAVRAMRPEVTMDLVGDQRERWLARLAGSRRHLHIGWADGHPFNHLIRNPLGKGRPLVMVPSDIANVYDGYSLFVEQLLRGSYSGTVKGGHPAARAADGTRRERLRIGLHPFASQPCKYWLEDRWQALAERLVSLGHEVTTFAAPSESSRLERLLGPVGQRVQRSVGALPAFEQAVRELDLMIGLDSFSIHLAESVGTPTLMLNAGNPPKMWKPPHGRVIGNGGGCRHHPCYNVPRCDPGAEYVCIRSTTVEAVVHEAASILRGG